MPPAPSVEARTVTQVSPPLEPSDPGLPTPATSLDARPYGVLGLILSLVAILVLTVVFALIATAAALGLLAASQGVPAALALVKGALKGGTAAGHHGQHLDVVLGILTYIALILAVIAMAAIRAGRGWRALLAWRSWRPQRYWKLFLTLFALTIAWEVLASVAIEHFHPEAKDWVNPPREAPWFIGFLVLAVLVGPLAEEVLFRGWMYTSLRASFGAVAAVLVTSVLFAIAHWESTHLYALAVFPVGLALALIRERAGSIRASFVFHALYNGAASVMLFFDK